MAVQDRITAIVVPVLTDLGMELYDLEASGSLVRVTVDRPGGVDLDAIELATRIISRELDHADPIPGRYTLEVSSPGLERPLRTPAHFRGAVGRVVQVRTLPGVEGERRFQGVLAAADDDGITVVVSGGEGDPAGTGRRLAYDQIERARTVFEWGGQPKPGQPKGGGARQPTGTKKKPGPTESSRRAS